MSLEKVVLRCFRTLVSLSHFSFVETCVHPGERLESSMTDNSRAAFLLARQCWPDRGQEDLIPSAAKPIYEAWRAAYPDTRRISLDAAMANGLTRAPGKDTGPHFILGSPSRDTVRPCGR
jgi:hypothetical protein